MHNQGRMVVKRQTKPQVAAFTPESHLRLVLHIDMETHPGNRSTSSGLYAKTPSDYRLLHMQPVFSLIEHC